MLGANTLGNVSVTTEMVEGIALLTERADELKSFDDTIVAAEQWCVVLGDPGSGKSTALKRVILDYIEQANAQSRVRYSGIPIFIPLREFARERYGKGQGYSLLDFMYDYASGSLTAYCSQGFFEYFLEKGECLICIDGLDEIVVPGQRQDVRDIVVAFARRYPANRYIVTSRIVGYNEAPLSSRLFPHYLVQPLDDLGIRLYIDKWYHSREKSQALANEYASELIDAIMNREGLHNLAQSPLLLAIIALIHRTEAALPYERVKLYDKCSEALLTTIDAVKRLGRTDSEKVYFRFRREILEAVAFWMHSEQSSTSVHEGIVNEADLRLYIARWFLTDPTLGLNKADALQQADSFIKLMQERTGLLIERGEKQFAFLHLTFQEYFTASYIWRNHLFDLEEMWKLIAPHLVDPSWREIILLLLGKLSDFARMPSIFINRMLTVPADEDEQILHRRLSVATSCLADNIRFDIALQKQIVEKWIDIVRTPLCNSQAELALDALATTRQSPLVQDKIHQLTTDAKEPAFLRLVLALLFAVDAVVPDWLLQALSGIVFDRTASGSVRRRALDQIIRLNPNIDNVRELSLKLMNSDDDSMSVCVDIFMHPRYGILLQEYLSSQGEALLKRRGEGREQHPQWDKEDLARFVKADPYFAPLLASEGWKYAWYWLIRFLQTIDRPSEPLTELLESNVVQNIPPRYRKVLIKALESVAQRTSLGPGSASAIHWLMELDYPAEDLFNLVLKIDSLYELDDWRIKRMSPFFEQLLNRSSVNDDLKHTWLKKIMQVKHISLQLSFVNALSDVDIRYFIREIEDIIFRTHYYDFACSIARILAERELISSDEMIAAFKRLLAQSESRWAKGSAVNYLYNLGELDAQTCRSIYLELADQEENIFLKQEAAQRAAKLGAIKEGARILRKVIIRVDADHSAKNAAFKALQEIVSLDADGSQDVTKLY